MSSSSSSSRPLSYSGLAPASSSSSSSSSCSSSFYTRLVLVLVLVVLFITVAEVDGAVTTTNTNVNTKKNIHHLRRGTTGTQQTIPITTTTTKNNNNNNNIDNNSNKIDNNNNNDRSILQEEETSNLKRIQERTDKRRIRQSSRLLLLPSLDDKEEKGKDYEYSTTTTTTTTAAAAAAAAASDNDNSIIQQPQQRHLEDEEEHHDEHENHHHDDDDDDEQQQQQHQQVIIQVANSETFEILFGILLVCIVTVRTFCFTILVWFRNNENLRLGQPSVLAVLVVAGSVSIASCYFLILRNTTFCYLRDVMILTPLTLSGCILLGRVWRIVILLTPVLQLDHHHHHEEDEWMGWGMYLKVKLLHLLTTWADWYYPVSNVCSIVFWPCVSSCKGISKLSSCWQNNNNNNNQNNNNNNTKTKRTTKRNNNNRKSNNRRPFRRQKTSMTLKKQIPIQQLVWLVFLLMLPQVILQVCVLVIPSLQEKLLEEPVILPTTAAHGDHHDDIIVLRQCCGSDQEYAWQLYLGIALCLVPYVLTGILSWNASDDLPKVFDEARAMTQSFKFLALVGIVALPPLVFGDHNQDPDTYVYLVTMLVCGLAIPPVWFIVYPKIWQAYADDNNSHNNNNTKRGRRRRNRGSGGPDDASYFSSAQFSITSPGSTTTGNNNNNNSTSGAMNTSRGVRRLLRKKRSKKFLPNASESRDQAKSAKLALTIGKMYEEMGLHKKSIDLFEEALAVWECDPNRHSKDKVGGYTMDEINAFSVTDLECICQLLIAKGRVEGTFNSAVTKAQYSAANAWLDALEIYEKAPARAKIKDRSFLFPVFSGIFVFLKGGKIQQDEKCSFEQNLGRKFVRETKLQGDPIHYTRALAMLCETNGRLGRQKSALESFETLKAIYDPLEHSEGVSAAYGTDRSAQAFSQAALWHLELGNADAALAACEYVINDLMPLMDPTNILNMCEMLLPVIYTFKMRGQDIKRMRDLFHKYVIQNFNTHFGKDGVTPCKPVFKPMLLLLDICHDPAGYPDLVDTVEWLVEEENGVIPEFVDSVYTKLCWSMHGLMAENCLRVANMLLDINGDINDVQTLVRKGLSLCRKAEKKIKNKRGTVILSVAYKMLEPVYSEIKELAEAMEMEWEEYSVDGSKSGSSLAADPKNLPSSYLRGRSGNNGSSEGSYSSEGGRASRRMSGFSHGTSFSNNSSDYTGPDDGFPLQDLMVPLGQPIPEVDEFDTRMHEYSDHDCKNDKHSDHGDCNNTSSGSFCSEMMEPEIGEEEHPMDAEVPPPAMAETSTDPVPPPPSSLSRESSKSLTPRVSNYCPKRDSLTCQRSVGALLQNSNEDTDKKSTTLVPGTPEQPPAVNDTALMIGTHGTTKKTNPIANISGATMISWEPIK